MEVEFDVQMTSADLYDYMLHHTYTSASGLIGSVAGALMVVAGASGGGILCLIAGIIVLLYLPVTLFLKSKQQFLSNPSFKKPLHFKMTEEGIEEEGTHEELLAKQGIYEKLYNMQFQKV